MLFDIIWSLIVALFCISVFALFIWAVIKTETGKKITAFIVFFVILVIASGVLAESATTEVIVNPATMTIEAVNGILLISFPYENDILSFWWEGKLEIRTMIITISNGKAINAKYYEGVIRNEKALVTK